MDHLYDSGEKLPYFVMDLELVIEFTQLLCSSK